MVDGHQSEKGEKEAAYRIEVCGGIASGKTTFAGLMENLKLKILFEDFKKNPFWEAFYTNPGKYIFETEITFLLLHFHQIKKDLESQNKIGVCDFSFLLDLSYAKVGLTGSKLEAFEKVYSEITMELGPPSLIIYLKCDAETELRRIRGRGRAEENMITLKFLESLNLALEKEIEKHQADSMIMTIDSSIRDFANDKSVQDEMRKLISDHLSDFQ
ncbi:MAG: deoxynucleoside kinase [Deltaproteobacteria bacterium]|nr:deoxynucleoside kinase [Deltaproteobacteria bacterium]